jgi:hypothetical protein
MINNFKVLSAEVQPTINIMKEVAKWGRSAGLNVWKDEHLTREKLMVGINEKYINYVLGEIILD